MLLCTRLIMDDCGCFADEWIFFAFVRSDRTLLCSTSSSVVRLGAATRRREDIIVVCRSRSRNSDCGICIVVNSDWREKRVRFSEWPKPSSFVPVTHSFPEGQRVLPDANSACCARKRERFVFFGWTKLSSLPDYSKG